jgi:glutamate carboxypeptidase
VTDLRDWIAAHRDDMLADLGRYVGIETPSDDKPSLDAGLSWLHDWLRGRLGEPAGTRHTDGGPYGDIRVYDYRGAGDEPVLLLCHYDTVWPLGTLAARPFLVDGDRITGPGVFDMKAGLVQAVWALRALGAAGLPAPPVRLLLSGDEEIGSPASRPVIEAEARGTRAAFVFEASADSAVKTARKGVGLFQVTAAGVEAHAGLAPRDPRAALTLSGGWNRPVMERAPAVAALFELARDLAAGLDITLRECAVGGASDGNFVVALGIPVLDGIGAVGDGAHARHERASVNGMLERTALAAVVLNALATAPALVG